MSQATYKSTRLLVEAVNREMESVRKAAMGNLALGSLNELRDLVAQLARMAERMAVEDVPELAPAEYVAVMKPLVAEYHRVLSARDMLAPCLCMDLRANACVVILVGDGKSSVKAAHDPDRPEAALAVETILAQLDDGTKKVATRIAAVVEQDSRLDPEPTCGGCDCLAGCCDCPGCEGYDYAPDQVRVFTGEVTEEDASVADVKTEPETGGEG